MPKNIHDILRDVDSGKLAIPDFQRKLAWEQEDIKNLLSSILGEYHIGTLLLLESKSDCPFKYRKVKGATTEIDSNFSLILDGQQRVASLVYAIKEPDLPFTGRKSPVRYFIDLSVLEGDHLDWERCVVYSLTSNKRKIELYSNENVYVPFPLFYDTAKLANKYKNHKLQAELVTKSSEFRQHEVHSYKLPHDTSFHRVVETFERVNNSGKPLSSYDLIKACFYKKGIKLEDFLKESQMTYESAYWWPKSNEKENILIINVLKVISLSENGGISKGELINLDTNKLKAKWKDAIKNIDNAYNRVNEIYGAFKQKYIPIEPMILPLAALLLHVGKGQDSKFKKIDRWYWNACFCGRYSQAANTRSESDVAKMFEWISSDKDQDILDFFNSYDINQIDFDNIKKYSYLHRTIICLLIKSGCKDFKTGQVPKTLLDSAEEDHIFPSLKYGDDNILNRTIITTNESKNDGVPMEYFGELQKKHERSVLLEILKSHLISNHGLNALMENQIEDFKEDRKINLIEYMKKLSS